MNSSELKGFLTGLILGDGTIDKGIHKRSFSIKSINKEFIDMISQAVDDCSGFKAKVRYTPACYAGGCYHRESWEYVVLAHPYFAKIYHCFYDDHRRRVINSEALGWLTPRGIASWYMSDGYVCHVGKEKGVIRDRRMDICTDRYTRPDIEKIRTMFKTRFGIETSIVKRDEFYRLRIMKRSYEAFITLIYPYVVPSMRYKLYLAYDRQPIWMSDDLWAIQEDLKSANPLPLSA